MQLNLMTAENVENAPSILIYFWIESLGDFLHTMSRAVRLHGAKPEDLARDQVNAYDDQTALMNLLKSRPEFAFADHDEYMLWYRWWNHWHKHELTDSQWRVLNALLKWDGTQTEATFADWRPSGVWKKQPAITEQVE